MRVGIQAKVSGFLVLVLALAFGVSTFFSTAQTAGILAASGEQARAALRASAHDQARNVFASLEIGTKGSLERGEMEVFEGLLRALGEIRGVEEIGITDPKGKITHSTRAAAKGQALAEEVFAAATTADWHEVAVEHGDSLSLARAHPMTTDCLRCHEGVRVGDLSGVLFVRYRLDDLAAQERAQVASFASARRRSVAAGVATGLAGLVAASLGVYLLLGRLVRRPLERLHERVREMASGEADLTLRLPAEATDETGDLARAFNAFVENLQGLVGEVLTTSRDVSRGTREILAASRAVLDRATRQSDRTTAAASSAEEMSATVLEVAKGAHEAAQVARSATRTAEAGDTVVEQGVAGMDQVQARVRAIAERVQELGERSQAIGQVMQVIDDIADQTNLLALNAAIEAARAAEHGRGFAVVADEVRKLSEKTAQATRQVRDTVSAIQTETQEAIGSVAAGLAEADRSGDLARQAGRALRDVVSKIEQNCEMVGQIATATEQQSAAVAEISDNLDSISELSAEVVTGVQQTAATAERVGAETERLASLVGRFRV